MSNKIECFSKKAIKICQIYLFIPDVSIDMLSFKDIIDFLDQNCLAHNLAQ